MNEENTVADNEVFSQNPHLPFPEVLKIPLIVGVTGHIDILNTEPEIAALMRSFWEKLRQLVGAETPVILLSAIAAGADHFAVKYRPENLKYCAVLPFDEAEYRKDFSGPALAAFEEDLRGAYKVVNCGGEVRDYAAASDYIRRHSDVLITLWDGYETINAKTGKPEKCGTYHQIRMAFGMDDLLLPHQEKRHLIVNFPVVRGRKGPDYHRLHGEKRCPGYSEDPVPSVVERNGETGELVFSPFADYALDTDRKASVPKNGEYPDFRSVLNLIRRHNEELPATFDERIYLRDKMESYAEAMAIVADDFDRFEYFDAVARKHQTPHKKQFFRIALWSVAVGVLGQAWGALTFSSDDTIHEYVLHGVMLLYLAGCIGVFLFGRMIAREDHYTRYLRPRVVAELLRQKIFWMLAGIKQSFTEYILDESANYLFSLPLCNWDVAAAPFSAADLKYLDDGNGLEAVLTCWLMDQRDYYSGYLLPADPDHFVLPQKDEGCKSKRFLSAAWLKKYFRIYERLEGYTNFFKNFFTWSGFVLAGILIIIFISGRIFHFDHNEVLAIGWYREFLVGICPFAVATLGWLLEKKNWDFLGRQYRNAWKLFDKTADFVGSPGNSLEDKKRIIGELILFAHRENAEWNDIKNNSKPEPMV